MTRALIADSAADVCAITVDALPATGGGPASWPVAAGALLVVLGAITLAFAARSRRRATAIPRHTGRRRGVAAWAAALMGVALVATPLTTPPAHAIDVLHSDGCRLIAVSDIVALEGASLLPGDTVALLEVTVTNRYDGVVSVLPEITRRDASADAAAIVFAVSDAAHGTAPTPPVAPIDLARGQSARLSVTASLPLHADDTAQHTRSAITLHLTTTERPDTEDVSP